MSQEQLNVNTEVSQQAETVSDFLSRCYVNFVNDKVFVYKDEESLLNQGVVLQVWDLQTSREYIKYLVGVHGEGEENSY